VVAVKVVGGSHCEDMGMSAQDDSVSMKEAKLLKAALVTRWLEDGDGSYYKS
jgi:hypothetical protein